MGSRVMRILIFSRKPNASAVPEDMEKRVDRIIDLAGFYYNRKKIHGFYNTHVIRDYKSPLPLVP